MFPVESQPFFQGKASSNTWPKTTWKELMWPPSEELLARCKPGPENQLPVVLRRPFPPKCTCSSSAPQGWAHLVSSVSIQENRILGHKAACWKYNLSLSYFWLDSFSSALVPPFVLCGLQHYSLSLAGVPVDKSQNVCWHWFRHHQPPIVSRVSFMSSQKGPPPVQSHWEPESGRKKHEEPRGEHLPKERCP